MAKNKVPLKKGIDYIGVGVGAIIVDLEGKFFLAQRGKKARNERGKWEFPGGSVEFGEEHRQALIREMKEEFGITISVGKLLQVNDHIIVDERQHWVSPAYFCEIITGTPTIKEPNKCSAIGWFTLEEMIRLPLTIITEENRKTIKEIFS